MYIIVTYNLQYIRIYYCVQIRHRLLHDRMYFNVAGKEAGPAADGAKNAALHYEVYNYMIYIIA